jgi:pyrroline-5-carboxylate reductase
MTGRRGPIVLVGCGKMGSALLRGWLERGLPAAEVTVVEPGPAQARAASGLGVRVVADAAELPAALEPAVILLAVKPQTMDEAAAPYHRFAGSACFLSIAAGRTIAGFERLFGAEAAIVRAMPNTPAAVGRGITIACANRNVAPAQRQACHDLLAAVGEVGWVEDESQIDAVTAVSGSGPAYVFLLIEYLAEAGAAVGLAPDLALRLARATVCGAGELAFRASESAAELRRNVTSPGGTTEAALKVLMAPDGLKPLLTRAVAAARDRSRELSG